MKFLKSKKKETVFPWYELDELKRRFDRLLHFRDSIQDDEFPERSYSPPADVLETNDALIVNYVLPGIESDDVDVSVLSNVLTIKGEKNQISEFDDCRIHRREIWEGRFKRTIALPAAIDNSRINATLQNGVLSIHLPKTMESEAQQVSVKD